MNTCLNCNQEIPEGARFCPECGAPHEASEARADADRVARTHRVSPVWIAATIVAFLLGGAVSATVLIALRKPSSRPQMAKVAHMETLRSRMAGMPPGHFHGQLPSGHPVPGNARENEVVIKAANQARQNPKDIAVWNRYGNLAERFAMFNRANYAKARAAYAHVLAMDPDNSVALRGIGNVYYDTHRYQKAIDAYTRYLAKHPDDVHVRTDLGTMYLSQHNSSQALKEYKLALAHGSGFFPAEYNLAVAYLLLNQTGRARDAFSRARAAAPDEKTRARVDEMIAKLDATAARSGTVQSNRDSLEASNVKAVSP